MTTKEWMSTREAAEYLGVTKPQIFRLLNENKIYAILNMEAPVPYYQIDRGSVYKYKKSPKNRGGRPSRKGG
jgi:phage antirepressor YoqD-like protein